MYDLNAIRIFVKVVEKEGFTAAANVLDMPKSKVSRVIAQLEEQLDTRLLERTTRHVRLTEAGKLFYQYAQRISAEAEQAESAMQSLSEKASGQLRISTSVSLGQYLLAPDLTKFLNSYPEVELDLELSNRRVDLIEENFDAAIRVGELADSSLVAKRLGNARIQLYASKKYLEKNGIPNHPAELSQHKILCMPDAMQKEKLSMQNTSGEKQSVSLHYSSKVNDFGTLFTLSKGDYGITILPSFMCGSESQLINVLPDWELPSVPICVLYPSHRGATPKLRAFIDFLDKYVVTKLVR